MNRKRRVVPSSRGVEGCPALLFSSPSLPDEINEAISSLRTSLLECSHSMGMLQQH